MEFKIKYTEADVQQAYTLHLKRFFPFLANFLLICGSIGLLLGLLLYLLLESKLHGIMMLLFGFVALAIHVQRSRTLGKRMFQKIGLLKKEHIFTITDTRVRLEVLEEGSREEEWPFYKMATLAPEIIVLYHNPHEMIFIPKRAISKEDFKSLTALVKSNIKEIWDY